MPPPWRVCCLTSDLSSGLDRKLRSNPGALSGLTTGTQHRKASRAWSEARRSAHWSLSLSRTGLPALPSGSPPKVSWWGGQGTVTSPTLPRPPTKLPEDPCMAQRPTWICLTLSSPLPRLGPWLLRPQSPLLVACVSLPVAMTLLHNKHPTRLWPGSPPGLGQAHGLGCLSH